MIDRGAGPYFYLPKLESHLEARLWNDVFLFLQQWHGIPRGTVRARGETWTAEAEASLTALLGTADRHGLNADEFRRPLAAAREGAAREAALSLAALNYAEALARGLRRWTDPACTAAALGIGGAKNPAIVDAVLRANRSEGDPVSPDKVTANEALWRAPAVATEGELPGEDLVQRGIVDLQEGERIN